MPNFHRQYRPTGTFFFTVVTYHRVPYFRDDRLAECLLKIMADVEREMSITRIAFVILPDHLHTLHSMPEAHCDYSKYWALVKLRFIRQARPLLSEWSLTVRASAARLRRRESLVWQNRFWEHEVRDSDDFAAHFHYIHFNPVKHGIAAHPADWRYSSFQEYVEDGTYSRDWSGLTEWPKGIGRE